MAYEKQTWVDRVTPLDAEHMNHIEDGIAEIVGIESIEQTTTSTSDGGTNVITATLSNGTTAKFNIKNGSKGSTGGKGETGATGAAGVGIKTVAQTTTSNADGGSNVITVTKTDGTTSTFTVKNGSKGSKGDAGAAGANGYTPVKGTDYYTPADQESIVQQVIAALGTPVYGTVGENKTIILEADLGEGTYTFMLKKDDGSLALIGTGEYQSGPKYTNALTKAIDTDGQPYNSGKGWKDGYRLNSSAAESADAAADVTGFIPAKWGDTLYLSDVKLSANSKNYIYLYESNFAKTGSYFRGDTTFNTAVEKGGIVLDDSGNVKSIKLDLTTYNNDDGASSVVYVRISCDQITDDSIITVNEPIE